MSEDFPRVSAVLAQECESTQIQNIAQLLGRVPMERLLNLPNHETLQVRDISRNDEPAVTVIRHRRTNLEQNREDHYFVFQTGSDTPKLSQYIDNLLDEEACMAEDRFDEIAALQEKMLDLAIERAMPADPHDGDELSRLLRHIVGR